MRRFFILAYLLLTGLTFELNAQFYPIEGILTSQMTYSGNLHNLADDITGLDLTLILRDERVAELDVQLRFYLTGPSLSLETSTDLAFAPIPLVLNEPTRLMGADLFEYFLPQSFRNPPDALIQSGGQLPEGMYTICVEVVSLNRLAESVLSDRICTLTDMDLLDPPKITSPYDGEVILDATPDFQLPINFSWLMNYSNLVFPIDYYLYIYAYDEQIMEFGLDAGWDNLQPFFDPVLVQSSEFMTSYLFNGSEAVDLMEVGQQYIVRVQATSLDENVFIRNEGYSDPVIFQYGSLEEIAEAQCAAPEITSTTKALSDSSYTVGWDPVDLASSYDVLIWNDDGSLHDSLFTTATTLQLSGFDPELRYEGYVVANCESGERVPSDPFFISLNLNAPTIVYNCGVDAQPLLNDNRELIGGLQERDTVIAGDFKVAVRDLTGPFSGTGVMIWNFPISSFLTDAEPIAVNVEFNNISVNTDYQMFKGVMSITGAGVELVNPELAEFLTDFGSQDYTSLELIEGPRLVEVSGEIGGVGGISVDPVTGEIVIVDSDEVIAWDQEDLEIVDAEGNVYAVDEDGNVVAAGQQDPDGPATSENTDGVDEAGTVQELVKLGITFSNGTGNQYAYDDVSENASNAEKALYFPTPIAGSSEQYYFVHKAVGNGSSGETVIATVDPSINPADIIFKTRSGRLIAKSEPNGQQITLTLPGIFTSAGEDILATQKLEDGRQAVVGVMQVNYLPGRAVNVVAIPVNGGTVPSNLSSTLRDVFGPVGVTYNLSEETAIAVGTDFLGPDNVLEGDGTGIFSVYTSEQQALNAAVQSALGSDYDSETYYLLFPDFSSSASLAGNMPLNRQWGYIFPDGSVESKGTQSQTAAHEIGHGVFRLEHPWSRYDIPEGSTDWLMDYAGGVELPFTHWNQIYDPELRLYVFQGEEESAAVTAAFYDPWEGLEHFTLESFPAQGIISFLDWSTRIVSFEADNVTDLSFHKGLIVEFTVEKSSGEKERYRAFKDPANQEFSAFSANHTQNNEGAWVPPLSGEEDYYIDQYSKSKDNKEVYLVFEEDGCKAAIRKYDYLLDIPLEDFQPGAISEDPVYPDRLGEISSVDLEKATDETSVEGDFMACLPKALRVVYRYSDENHSIANEAAFRKLLTDASKKFNAGIEFLNVERITGSDQLDFQYRYQSGLDVFITDLRQKVDSSGASTLNIRLADEDNSGFLDQISSVDIPALADIKEVLGVIESVYECATSGGTSQPENYIPRCFWENADVPTVAYYSPADLPYVVGFLDGAIGLIDGIAFLVVEAVKVTNAWTLKLWLCNINNPQEIANDYIELVNVSGEMAEALIAAGNIYTATIYRSLTEEQRNSIAQLRTIDPVVIELDSKLLDELQSAYTIIDSKVADIKELFEDSWFKKYIPLITCSEAEEYRTKTVELVGTVADFINPAQDNDALRKGVYDSVSEIVSSYASKISGFNNEARYLHGKVSFEVVTFLLTGGTAQLTKWWPRGSAVGAEVIGSISKLTKAMFKANAGSRKIRIGPKKNADGSVADVDVKYDDAEVGTLDGEGRINVDEGKWADETDDIVDSEKLDDVEYVDRDGNHQQGDLEFVENANGEKKVRRLLTLARRRAAFYARHDIPVGHPFRGRLDALSDADQVKFLDDFDYADDLTITFFKSNDSGIKAWDAVKHLPEEIKLNPDVLEIISDYMARSRKSADEVVGEIPISSLNDVKKWLGERKIEPFLSSNPKIIDLADDAPEGYNIARQSDGTYYIRRNSKSDPYTPQLTVRDGIVVRYDGPARISHSPTFSKNLEDVFGPMPGAHQRHHLVSDNVVQKSHLHQFAGNKGWYAIDRATNGRYLAETADDFIDGISKNLPNHPTGTNPTHLGPHPQYDSKITGHIDNVLQAAGVDDAATFDFSKISKPQIVEMIDEIEKLSLNTLENWQPAHLN